MDSCVKDHQCYETPSVGDHGDSVSVINAPSVMLTPTAMEIINEGLLFCTCIVHIHTQTQTHTHTHTHTHTCTHTHVCLCIIYVIRF